MTTENLLSENPLLDADSDKKSPVFTIAELSPNDIVLVFQPSSQFTTRFRVVYVKDDVIQLETHPLNGSTPMQRVVTHDKMYELGFVHIGTMPSKFKRLFGITVNSF